MNLNILEKWAVKFDLIFFFLNKIWKIRLNSHYGLNHDGVIVSHGYVSHDVQDKKVFLALNGNDSWSIRSHSFCAF